MIWRYPYFWKHPFRKSFGEEQCHGQHARQTHQNDGMMGLETCGFFFEDVPWLFLATICWIPFSFRNTFIDKFNEVYVFPQIHISCFWILSGMFVVKLEVETFTLLCVGMSVQFFPCLFSKKSTHFSRRHVGPLNGSPGSYMLGPVRFEKITGNLRDEKSM